MYHTLTEILFRAYWLIVLVTTVLIAREAIRERDWRSQATAALALMPFLLRGLLVK